MKKGDFKKATRIARAMVTKYGMSKLGPTQLEEESESVFLGRDYNKSKNFSDAVALEIDQEVRNIIEECYKKTTQILKDNKKLVTLIADTLIERETITKEEIEELVSTGKIAPKDEDLMKDLKAKAKDLGIKGYTKMSKEELEEKIKESEK